MKKKSEEGVRKVKTGEQCISRHWQQQQRDSIRFLPQRLPLLLLHACFRCRKKMQTVEEIECGKRTRQAGGQQDEYSRD